MSLIGCDDTLGERVYDAISPHFTRGTLDSCPVLRALFKRGVTRPLTVDELAARAGLDRKTFYRRACSAGMSNPKALLRAARVFDLVPLLICHTEVPLWQIAEQAGYPDYVSFQRAVRSVFGMGAGELRAARPSSDELVRLAHPALVETLTASGRKRGCPTCRMPSGIPSGIPSGRSGG